MLQVLDPAERTLPLGGAHPAARSGDRRGACDVDPAVSRTAYLRRCRPTWIACRPSARRLGVERHLLPTDGPLDPALVSILAGRGRSGREAAAVSFLYPLFLAALAAVAVPMVLHLARRRTRRELPFSTCASWRRRRPGCERRRRLEHWLLLALRGPGGGPAGGRLRPAVLHPAAARAAARPAGAGRCCCWT